MDCQRVNLLSIQLVGLPEIEGGGQGHTHVMSHSHDIVQPFTAPRYIITRSDARSSNRGCGSEVLGKEAEETF